MRTADASDRVHDIRGDVARARRAPRRVQAGVLAARRFVPAADRWWARRSGSPAAPRYDAQPRFSPDGTKLAFASDRNGIENLWTCDLDGKNAKQVSSEKDSTVNGPAWSRDGEYLVGRKRLTDASSLGTVELWMWHVRVDRACS
jgi:dipeptidyl aminopeptidase/acylaminoacyl peptidase